MSKTLYISDLDGTLLNQNAKVSEFTAHTLNELIAKGMLFSVASARSIISAKGLLDEVNMNLPGIFMNGVLLCDTKTNITVDFCPLENNAAKALIEAFSQNGRPPFVFSFTGDKVQGGYNSSISVEYKQLMTAADVDFYENRKHKYDRFDRVDEYLVNNPIYVNGFGNEQVIGSVYDMASKIEGVSAEKYLDIYTDEWLLECHNDSCTKASRAIEMKKATKADRLVVFGDNYNDMGMMSVADVAVAVDNAPDDVKAVAHVIIDSNQNDGVAKFLLNEFKKAD
ncbi:MAG: HAD-IIB family hydrolase [Clostridia bacterium]|nr:HAD-IIB family hydrolase [Clostridia bacterium]